MDRKDNGGKGSVMRGREEEGRIKVSVILLHQHQPITKRDPWLQVWKACWQTGFKLSLLLQLPRSLWLSDFPLHTGTVLPKERRQFPLPGEPCRGTWQRQGIDAAAERTLYRLEARQNAKAAGERQAGAEEGLDLSTLLLAAQSQHEPHTHTLARPDYSL